MNILINPTTAVPGSPVLVTPVSTGGFGNTKGSIELLPNQGAAIAVPTTAVHWTSTQVLFTVPDDLPAGSYQVTVTVGNDKGTAALQLVYPDLPVSIAAVVPPVVTAEEPFEILGTGFGANPVVTVEGVGLSLNVTKLSPLHLRATMHTVRKIQSDLDDYDANDRRVDVVVRVENPNRADSATKAATFPVKLLLPLPQTGPGRLTKEWLYVGRVDSAHLPQGTTAADFPKIGDTQWLGGPRARQHAPVGSELRLYEPDQDPSATLAGLLATLGAANTQTATDNALEALAVEREKGKLVPYADISWHEESLVVKASAVGIDAGYLVVWREDLPSPPIAFLRAPEPPSLPCDATGLLPHVADMLRATSSIGEGASVPAGTPISIQLDPGPNTLNVLKPILAAAGRSISVRIRLAPMDGATGQVAWGGNAPTGGFDTFTGTARTATAMMSPLLTGEGDQNPGVRWNLVVEAQVHLPTCPDPTTVPLLDVRFRQAPLKIPTVALCFEHANYTGSAVVMLPEETTLEGPQKADASTGNVNDAVTTLKTLLVGTNGTPGTLTILQTLLGLNLITGVSAAAVGEMAKIISNNLGAANTSLAYTQLGDFGLVDIKRVNGDYQDMLSSIAVLGAPGHPQWRMWEAWDWFSNKWVGRKVAVQVTSGITGGIPNFTNCRAADPVLGNALNEGNSYFGNNNDQTNLNDTGTGIRFRAY